MLLSRSSLEEASGYGLQPPRQWAESAISASVSGQRELHTYSSRQGMDLSAMLLGIPLKRVSLTFAPAYSYSPERDDGF